MKCPDDQSEMKKGITNGLAWTDKLVFLRLPWIGKKLWAYHCPKCGKVELTTEVKK